MSTGLLARGRRAELAPVGGMDPRLQARRADVARRRGRRRLRRLLALAVVTVVALGALALTRSPLLDVDQVTVAGARQTGAAAVVEAAGIERGRAMTSVDLAAATARLAALPWVASAEVARDWPGTVQIVIEERVPVAAVDTASGMLLVDRSGQALGPAGPGTGPRVPTLRGQVDLRPGERLIGSRAALVALLADVPPAVLAEVDEARTGPSGTFSFILTDGIEVAWGDARRTAAKSDSLLVVLDKAGRATIDTVDVAVPTAPALTRDRPGEA